MLGPSQKRRRHVCVEGMEISDAYVAAIRQVNATFHYLDLLNYKSRQLFYNLLPSFTGP